jgi:hypothetical protein
MFRAHTTNRAGNRAYASLSGGLLARKGAARPAMRSQANISEGEVAPLSALDDCGWNDLGHAARAVPVALETAPEPEVLRQRHALAEALTPAGPVAGSLAPARRPSGVALAEGRPAAFTLRLDADRHLRLRLACALAGSSAQRLVIAALDRLLADDPQLDEIVDHVQRQTPERR